MSEKASQTLKEQHLQAEIDRLRLLLQKACDYPKRQAFSIEIEPSRDGFRVIACGVSEKDEWRMAQQMADHLNVLLRGAIRFSLKALDDWPHTKGEPAANVRALGASDETAIPPEAKPKEPKR